MASKFCVVQDLVAIPKDRIFNLKINFQIKSCTPKLVAEVCNVSPASHNYKSENCVDYRQIFKVNQMFGFGISTVDKALVLPLGFQVYIYK